MKIKSFPSYHCFKIFPVLIITLLITISGCAPLLNMAFKKALPPTEGEMIVPGLKENVIVRRDNMGIPYIEAANKEDMFFAMGYVNAYDRFTQMEGFRLVSKGRLSELLGDATLEMDIYLRSLNLKQFAETMYLSASPDVKHLLQIYSDGINAYLANAPLPMTIKMAGHKPEPWQPVDSMYVFLVLTLGLGQNLHEEIDMLNIAQKIDVDKLAWLFPIYPDEPLPFKEFKKLQGIDLKTASNDLERLAAVAGQINKILVPETAASNNWVVSGKRTKSGKSILATDTHLPLCMPSLWHMMHLKCPGIDGAGIAIAGAPGIIAGYNGNIAVGMTMVMADNQDIFLEKLKQQPDGLYYLYKNKWLKATSREEKFRIKGKKDLITRTMYETRHGVLLNNILTDEPRHELVPMPVNQKLGIALSWAAKEPDVTIDTFLKISYAKSLDEVVKYTKENTSAIPLNLVIADKNNIAWQVTGRYPLRKNGRGLCPSPGWTGEYDWTGYLKPTQHPSSKNPAKGYIGTANHRTVPADFPYVLSSSWYYPDRAERIDEMMKSMKGYTAENAKAMQLDIYSPFVKTIKAVLLDKNDLPRMTAIWQKTNHAHAAQKAIDVLRTFDGYMTVDSAGAAFCNAFLFALSKNIFADELGGTDSRAYQSYLESILLTYSPIHDHLTPKCKTSPFWDNINTPDKEERYQILAQTVLDAIDILEKECGKDPDKWQWGKLHTLTWATDATKLADYMGFVEKTGIKFLSSYFDRGPYPAPGDHTTLNAAAYYPGKSFDAWLVPEMRMIVDFGSDEPLILVNSSGQSDNPSSPYYDDGVKAWYEGRYQIFPFKEENVKKHYTNVLTLAPKK